MSCRVFGIRHGLPVRDELLLRLQCEDAIEIPGGFFLCDEYGPFVYRFDAAGVLVATLRPPQAWIPRVGANYGARTVDV